MADEPRRSGRATKGQHTKNDESTEPELPKQGKGKAKARAKATKREVESDDAADDSDSGIRCICGVNKDIEGMMYIECEKCKAWQHNVCMGITEVRKQIPKHYFCEQCRPGDHRDLIAAIQNGITMTDFAVSRREDTKKKSKKSKISKRGISARESKGPELKSEGSGDAPISSAENTLSGSPSFTTDTPNQGQKANDTMPKATKATSRRRSSGTANSTGEAARKKRKTSSSAATGRKGSKAVDPTAIADSIDEMIEGPRKNAANQLMKRIAHCIQVLSNKGAFPVPDGESSSSLGEHFAIRVEHALYMQYAAENNDLGGQYKNQMLQIYFNIEKNDSLMLKMLNGSLESQTLAVMSSDEMANEKLQAEMAAMIEQSDKQNILVQDDGPRIRRTHKGEELIDNQNDHVTSEAISTSFIPRDRDSSAAKMEDTDAISPNSSRPEPMLARQSSSNFDINNVWSNVQQAPAIERRVSYATRIPEPAPTNLVNDDADIDRLLNDDASDVESVIEAHESNIVWKGLLTMPVVGTPEAFITKFQAQAHHVAGSDLSNRVPLLSLFVDNIEVVGAIPVQEADSYLCSLAASRNTDVCVLQLTAQNDDPASQAEFRKLYDKCLVKSRVLAIATPYNLRIRDAYVAALGSNAPEMQVFHRLAYVKIDQRAAQPAIVLIFVVKWLDDGLALFNSAQATPTSNAPMGQGNAPSFTPVPIHMMKSTPKDMTYEPSYYSNSPNAMPPAAHEQDIYRSMPIPANSYVVPATYVADGSAIQMPQGPSSQYQASFPGLQPPLTHYSSGPTEPNLPARQNDYSRDPRLVAAAVSSPFENVEQLMRAKNLLGPYFNSTTVQLLIQNGPSDGGFEPFYQSLEGVKRVINKNPEAAENFIVLQNELALDQAER